MLRGIGRSAFLLGFCSVTIAFLSCYRWRWRWLFGVGTRVLFGSVWGWWRLWREVGCDSAGKASILGSWWLIGSSHMRKFCWRAGISCRMSRKGRTKQAGLMSLSNLAKVKRLSWDWWVLLRCSQRFLEQDGSARYPLCLFLVNVLL